MPADTFKTLLLGDVYSLSSGRVLFLKLPSLIKKYQVDFVIANGENMHNGFGLTCEDVSELFSCGIDVITSGNHIWQQEDVFSFLDSQPNLLRPANYGSSVPGHGYTVKNGIGVINLQGRVNMGYTEDPFKWASDIVRKIKKDTKAIFVDFHAESGEEKEALGYFLDGDVTAVVGTHIHVQTADERILPNGTAYITDLGMCGPVDSIIGCDKQTALRRQLTQLPIKAVPAEGLCSITGVLVTSDRETGRAVSIERINE